MFKRVNLRHKFATYIGLTGVAYGALAWWFNYYNVPLLFVGYEYLAIPGRLALGCFSEETAFIPKVFIFLTGQFLGYAVLGVLLHLAGHYWPTTQGR